MTMIQEIFDSLANYFTDHIMRTGFVDADLAQSMGDGAAGGLFGLVTFHIIRKLLS